MSRIEQILEMLKDDPADAFLRYALALEHEKAGDITQAKEELKLLQQAQPDYLPVYYKLGKLCEQTAYREEAIHHYRQGIHLARQQGDTKTLGELNEALMLLEDE